MKILIVLKVSEQTVSVLSMKKVACHINTAIRHHMLIAMIVIMSRSVRKVAKPINVTRSDKTGLIAA